MRGALGFVAGFVLVLLLAVSMDAAHAQTEFDPLTWAESPEGIEAIGTYFGAGLIFPITGYAIGFGFGVLLRLIGGR